MAERAAPTSNSATTSSKTATIGSRRKPGILHQDGDEGVDGRTAFRAPFQSSSHHALQSLAVSGVPLAKGVTSPPFCSLQVQARQSVRLWNHALKRPLAEPLPTGATDVAARLSSHPFAFSHPVR